MRGANSQVSGRVEDVLAVASGALRVGRPLALPSHGPEGGAVMMRLTKNLGMVLLGIYLIAIGSLPLLNISPMGLGLILHLLAIAAGVSILLDR